MDLKEDQVIVFNKLLEFLNNDKNEILNISTKKHTNRQNYPKSYVPNGAIYIANYDFLKKEKTFFGTKSFAYIMPKKRSIDIDSIDDFLYADFLLKNNANLE